MNDDIRNDVTRSFEHAQNRHCQPQSILHRQIGIDMGHRVPDHGSKCRNPHGHRYTIVATCQGPVINDAGNAENGMVIDFGNIKTYMMDMLDAVFDHGFVVSKHDELMMDMFFPNQDPNEVYHEFENEWLRQRKQYNENVNNKQTVNPLNLPKALTDKDPAGMKVIVVQYTPTAENLARHMFKILQEPISFHYDKHIKLHGIRLYETPNGWVDHIE